jgi:hypothetical protein
VATHYDSFLGGKGDDHRESVAVYSMKPIERVLVLESSE